VLGAAALCAAAGVKAPVASQATVVTLSRAETFLIVARVIVESP
jgi:hypothetical protein